MRREKFNEERQKRIIDAIKIGATYEIAAEQAGVSRSTLYNWLTKGEKQTKGAYRTFLDTFKKAESTAAITCLQVINEEAIKGNWKCAAYLLERRHGYKRDSQFLRSDQLTQETPKNEKVKSPGELMKQQADELRRAIAKAEKAESWQAYSALQRQLLSVLVQIRQINSEDDKTFEDLTDEQIVGEISTMVTTLPPILKQRLLDEIVGLQQPNISILKR